MSLVCITNDIPDLRSCTIGGEHAEHCNGYAIRWDRDTEQRIFTDAECKGCLPALAEKGLLCWSCWEKFRDGLTTAVDIITHLRSIDRAAQLDNAGVRTATGWVIPVPNTWRTADDLIVMLGHPTPGFPSDAGVWEVDAITERYVDAVHPDAWASRTDTAELAVRFNGTMHSALIQHPMEDYEHRVRNVRCYECKQRSLLWKPPLMFEGEVRVECTNPECGYVVDQSGYAQLSTFEHVAVKEQLAAERKRLSKEKRDARAAERKALAAEAKRLEEEAANEQAALRGD